ncbi:MAG: cytochrome P450 [Agarilytica sp.]
MTNFVEEQISPISSAEVTASSDRFLDDYDAAPDDEKYPLARKWMDEQPLELFKQLRNERPILVTPEATIVTKFNDVRDILQMPTVFTVNLYEPKMEDYLMKHDDDALHTREKSFMEGFLNRNDLPHVRNIIARNAQEVLSEANGSMEAVNAYCRGVPASLVQDYFGFDRIERKSLIDWSYWSQYNSFHNHHFNLHSDEKFQHIVAEQKRSGEELADYITGVFARKLIGVKAEQAAGPLLHVWYALAKLACKLMGNDRYEVKDDIATRVLRSSFPKEVEFDLVRQGINVGGLLIGAIETTQQSVAQAIQYLIKNPEILARAKTAAKKEDTAEFDGYVWEALRFVPLSPYLFRQTAEKYTIAKGTNYATTVLPGTTVLIATQSAMFDEYCYDEAEKFIPERNWYHHFVFGFGAHECMGKYIGMVMIPEMVRQIVLLDDLKAECDIDYRDGPLPEEYNLTWG